MKPKEWVVPLVLTCAGSLIVLSDVVFGGRTFFLRDLTYLFHPWKTFAAESLQSGSMPLWNSYAYCGMPFLANWQSAVFYPFSILFYLFPFVPALKAFYAAHLIVAGVFAYLFARKIRFTPLAAAGMAVIFAFNGYLLTRLEFLSHVACDAWLFAPLAVIGHPLLLALALGIDFLGGHQSFFMVLMITALYYLVTLHRGSLLRSFGRAGVAAAVFLGIVAVQLLPTVELVRHAGRVREGIDAAVALTRSISFSDIPRLITPLFAPSFTENAIGENLPWSTTFHIGFVGVIAVIAAMILPISRRLRVFGIVFIVTGVLLSLGKTTPVYPWLYAHVPFFRVIRYPVQFMFMTIVGTAALAGAALNSCRYRVLSVVVVLLAFAELSVYNRHFQATAPRDYYQERPSSIAFLQADTVNNRFIVSPGTETNRNFRGDSIDGVWQIARGHLFNLVSMPYHVPNAYGSGEPLTLQPIDAAVDAAYRRNAAGAYPLYERLGVRYLVCRERLPDPGKYVLVYESGPFIYRLGSSPLPYALTAGAVRSIKRVQSRIDVVIESGEPTDLVWKEVYYPGWKLNVNGAPAELQEWGGLFRRFRVPAGNSRAVQVYRPFSYRIGTLITTIALLGLFLFGLRRASRSVEEGRRRA